MWFIWMMWAIAALAVTATVILLTGKGSMLVSGFNRKSSEERAKYDKKKVSRQAGLFMVLADIGLLALTSYIHFTLIFICIDSTILYRGNGVDKLLSCIFVGWLAG